MPTIDQLPPATAASDSDEFLVSQAGIARKITRAQILAGMQPELAISSGTLLGNYSSGTGAPEQITVGANLGLNNGILSADATPFVVASLPPGTVPAVGDLVPLSQGNNNTMVTYGQFMNGLTGVANVDASQLLVMPTGSQFSIKLSDFATNVLPLAGGTLAGALTLAANPATPMQAATKQYVDGQVATALPNSGGTLTGPLTLPAAPVASMQAATKQYVDGQVATALSNSGGTLTGPLTLPAAPVSSMQAATKQYVDGQVATALPKAGGTLSGSLTLAADPVGSLQAATKQYVDNNTLPYSVFNSGSFDFNALATTTCLTRIADNGGITYANGPIGTPRGTVLELEQANTGWLTQLFVGQGPSPTLYIRGTSAGSSGWSGWLPIPSSIARATCISALRALDVSGLGSANCMTIVDGYTTSGDGGGGEFDWSTSSTLADDGVIVFRPSAISSANPGRWIRRLPTGILTPEMAGAVGDYVFPAGSSPESGTENSAAFRRLFSAAGFYVASGGNANGLNGATIQVPSGKQYLIAGNVAMITGTRLEGTGSAIGGTLGVAPFTSIFADGGVLVIDPSCTFSVNADCRLANIHFLRRGMNMNPTSAQVGTFWASVSTDASIGISVTQGFAVMENVTVVGFNTGIQAVTAGIGYIRNCNLENWNCIEVSRAGDTNILDNVHCVPLYNPTADTPPNSDWKRKGGVAIYLYDQADTAIVKDCEAELWSVGIKLSNVWGVNVSRCRVETYTNNPDVCYQLRNVCSYVEFNECYAGGVIGYDLGATDYAHAPSPLPYPASQTQSQVLIRGGQIGGLVASSYTGTGSPCIFLISGNAAGTITDVHVNRQGTTVFTFLPGDGGVTFWNIADIRIDEDTLPATLASIASIDSSVAAGVHFNAIWASQQNKWIVPPNHNDSIDLVSSPVSAGSHTIADGASWCHLTPAGTLASYTLTMPADPIDKEELMISSSAAIAALTFLPNSGQTIDLPPTTLPAHGAVRFRFLAASSSWVRLIMQ